MYYTDILEGISFGELVSEMKIIIALQQALQQVDAGPN